jgi:hypothetical protein
MNISEETIDSFLRGDLSGADLEKFNSALAADPKLQQEVSIQRDIVESLKQYRHQQLKNRLNSIEMKPVGLGTFSSTYIKLAASIGVVALLVGGYILFNKNNVSSSISTNEAEKATVNSEIGESITTGAETPASDKTIANTTTAATENTSISSETASKNPAVSDTKKSSSNNVKGSKKSTAYTEPSDTEMNEDYAMDKVNDDFSIPTINDGSASISAPQIKVSIVKEKNLGYRFFNNQLFLHGNFSNSTYELYELNNKPSKQLFLYFENNYYELIQGKTKVTDLIPITDKTTLLQLTQLREH